MGVTNGRNRRFEGTNQPSKVRKPNALFEYPDLRPSTDNNNQCNIVINPRLEGYGSRFVVHSFYLSIVLQRTAFTSSCQLRYGQAKHVDGCNLTGGFCYCRLG